MRVLFVCLGNICRSPTAEGVMRALVRDAGLEVAVESAGTAGYHVGDPPDPRARAAAHARGVTLDGRAQQFTADDFARFDYVLSMDARVRTALDALARTPDQRRRVHNFRDFDATSPANAEVPDPYYGGADGFERVFDICDAACRGLLARLRQELDTADGSGAR